MKLLSWNVAGIRAVLRKNALDFTLNSDYDVLCFQETKAERSQVKDISKFTNEYPYQHWNHSKTKKGYSGTAIWSKQEFKELSSPGFDQEGRITAVEFETFQLVTVYTPNSKGDLSRLDERINIWDALFKIYCDELNQIKPLIICGDFNVIHQDIDIHKPEEHRGNIYAGFTDEERQSFTELLGYGYSDAFRMFNDKEGHYTWWSYMHGARNRNIGWRLDYFLVPDSLKKNTKSSEILKSVIGSDHCPITLNIEN